MNFLTQHLFQIPFASEFVFGWKKAGIVMGAIFMIVLVRYLIFSGAAYLIFWKWLRKRLHYRRIQQRFPEWLVLRREILWSLSTFIIFSINGVFVFWLTQKGYTLRYDKISDHGWVYLILSTVLMILVHDLYFYWSHRAMHHKLIFRHVHRVHHQSFNPSPWAAFCFHPTEAIAQAAIIYVLVFTIPHHPLALLLFLLFMTSINALGHLGYELFPKGFTQHTIGKWFNTSTHHNVHHHKGKQNYSLYFNWWDRWLGTNHSEYHEIYEEVTSRPKPQKEALESPTSITKDPHPTQ